MLGLKDGSELSSLCNSKSFSAPELDLFDLKGAVLLVAAVRLKIQPPCTEIRALSCAGKPGSSFDCQVLQGLAGMLTYPGTALLAQYQTEIEEPVKYPVSYFYSFPSLGDFARGCFLNTLQCQEVNHLQNRHI